MVRTEIGVGLDLVLEKSTLSKDGLEIFSNGEPGRFWGIVLGGKADNESTEAEDIPIEPRGVCDGEVGEGEIGWSG